MRRVGGVNVTGLEPVLSRTGAMHESPVHIGCTHAWWPRLPTHIGSLQVTQLQVCADYSRCPRTTLGAIEDLPVSCPAHAAYTHASIL